MLSEVANAGIYQRFSKFPAGYVGKICDLLKSVTTIDVRTCFHV